MRRSKSNISTQPIFSNICMKQTPTIIAPGWVATVPRTASFVTGTPRHRESTHQDYHLRVDLHGRFGGDLHTDALDRPDDLCRCLVDVGHVNHVR